MQFYDLGYLGIEKDFENQISILPYKKRSEKIDYYSKVVEQDQRSIRIKVKHVIAQIKKFRINKDTFRNKLCRYDAISDIVCGIVNFKIKWRQEFVVTP